MWAVAALALGSPWAVVAPGLTSYCPSLRASSTLGTSGRLPRKSSSETQREAALPSTGQVPAQACPQAEQERSACFLGPMLSPGGRAWVW